MLRYPVNSSPKNNKMPPTVHTPVTICQTILYVTLQVFKALCIRNNLNKIISTKGLSETTAFSTFASLLWTLLVKLFVPFVFLPYVLQSCLIFGFESVDTFLLLWVFPQGGFFYHFSGMQAFFLIRKLPIISPFVSTSPQFCFYFPRTRVLYCTVPHLPPPLPHTYGSLKISCFVLI